jgi:hypothetical protein
LFTTTLPNDEPNWNRFWSLVDDDAIIDDLKQYNDSSSSSSIVIGSTAQYVTWLRRHYYLCDKQFTSWLASSTRITSASIRASLLHQLQSLFLPPSGAHVIRIGTSSIMNGGFGAFVGAQPIPPLHRISYFWGHATPPVASSSFVDTSHVAPSSSLSPLPVTATTKSTTKGTWDYAVSIPDVKNIDPSWPLHTDRPCYGTCNTIPCTCSPIYPEFLQCPSPYINEAPPGIIANCGWLIDDDTITNEQTVQIFSLRHLLPGEELFISYGPYYTSRNYPVNDTRMTLIGLDHDSDEYYINYHIIEDSITGDIEFQRPSDVQAMLRSKRTIVEAHFMTTLPSFK